MAWNLPQHEHAKFERNTIALTVAQLRFHPILSVRERLPRFQERLRELFPIFRENKIQDVQLELGGIRVSEHDQFQFLKEDGSATLSLGSGAVSLEHRRHTHHEEFINDFRVGLGALLEVFAPVSPLRLGLRYINVIQKDRIAAALGKNLQWSDLVQPAFLQLPANLATLEGTRYSNEVTSSLDDGEMTVRHGLLPTPGSEELHFRLDVDRFVQHGFDPAETPDRLKAFSSDIYAVFISVAGAALIEWMSSKEH